MANEQRAMEEKERDVRAQILSLERDLSSLRIQLEALEQRLKDRDRALDGRLDYLAGIQRTLVGALLERNRRSGSDGTSARSASGS